ncbi:MAG: B12-binding domain-containing radical SAM protein [Myxococcota bacterium]
MNVVLFNPRAQTAHRRLPLSVLMLARVVRQPWELVDGNVEPDAIARLEGLCARPGTVLLVTVMPGPQLRVAAPLCRRLKARFPGLVVVWGGYFPTVHPAACARDAGVDWVVIGQGERTLPELLDAIERGGDPLAVPGVAGWRDGALAKAPSRGYLRPADFGDPPYERLDMERYAARTFLGRRTFNHHTSAGCPYFCNFCAVVNMFDGRWIPDPAESVVRIARRLARDHGADALEFHDNNFFAWEKRCREVADGIAGLGLSWWGEGRVDTMLGFSGETWEAMARSGLRMVFFGAESGDQGALDAMDKGGLTVDHTRELNRLARRHGVRPEFSFVLGHPADPEGDVAKSLALVRELKRDNPDCEIILYLYTPVPLPGPWEKSGFAFPETLDEWLAPPWDRYEARRDPRTPWLTPRLVRSVHDFEAVLHARHPTASDLRLKAWQRALLRLLAEPRWRFGLYTRPWELKALQKLWGYRRPEEMGF